jgi:hypothetical protein
MTYLSTKEIQNILTEKIPENLIVPQHTPEGHFYCHTPSGIVAPSVTTKAGILQDAHLKMWSANLAIAHIDKNWEILITADRNTRNGIFQSAVMVHQDTFEDAGDVGTRGHKVVDAYLTEWLKTGVRPTDIRTFIAEQDSRVFAIARSAEQWITDFNADPIASELNVFSKKYKFAGQLDSLFMVEKVIKKGTLPSCKHIGFRWQTSVKRPQETRCNDCGAIIKKVFTLVDWKSSNSISKATYAMQVSAYWKALYEMTRLKTEELIIVRLDKERCKYEVLRVLKPPKAFMAFVALAKVYDWLESKEQKFEPYTSKEVLSIGGINYKSI